MSSTTNTTAVNTNSQPTLSLVVDNTTNTSAQTSASSNPNVLPFGMGMMLMQIFFDLMKYQNEMVDQGYEATQESVQSMIGNSQTGSGATGMIGQWLTAGFNAAAQTGNALKDQAWGSLAQAIAGGVGVLGVSAGFARNQTSFMSSGKEDSFFNTPGRQRNDAVDDAKDVKNRMANATAGELKQGSEYKDSVAADPQRLQQVVDRTEAFKEGKVQKLNYVDAVDAAGKRIKIVDPVDLAAVSTLKSVGYEADFKKATEKADENVANAIGARNQMATVQNNYSQFVQMMTNSGSSSGQAWAQLQQATAQTDQTQDQALASLWQQTGQTTDGVRGKWSDSEQSNREGMGSTAISMGSALGATVYHG